MSHDKIIESEKPEAVSAGGMVVSSYGQSVRILLVRDINYDDWVCPKGHVEPGETLGQAALREIKEEAGVTEANILFELGTARRYVKTIPEWKTIHYFLILGVRHLAQRMGIIHSYATHKTISAPHEPRAGGNQPGTRGGRIPGRDRPKLEPPPVHHLTRN